MSTNNSSVDAEVAALLIAEWDMALKAEDGEEARKELSRIADAYGVPSGTADTAVAVWAQLRPVLARFAGIPAATAALAKPTRKKSTPKPKRNAASGDVPTEEAKQPRPPNNLERQAIEAATARVERKAKPVKFHWAKGQAGENRLAAPLHGDVTGFAYQLHDLLGTRSSDFTATALTDIDCVARNREDLGTGDPLRTNAALAFIAAIAPADELEAALAIQMAGTHALAADMLGMAKHATRTDHINLYGGLAVKLSRTFTAQIEALTRLRGGGKQQVEVRHVYVDARGSQNVISAGGGGGVLENGQQPFAQALGHALGPALLGQDQERDALPIAGDPGPETVPTSRGSQPRRAVRSRERKLSARPPNKGGRGDAT
jgi:hypothetical protein